MKFLIDECLHTSLVTLAHNAGHVRPRELPRAWGRKDWQLMTRIRTEEYTFGGSSSEPRYRTSGKRDLVSALLEVDIVGAAITCREYSYPLL